MTGSLAVYAVQIGCVVSGTLLAWRRPEHRPLTALMALGLAVDVALELALPFAARVALGTCYPWAAWAVAHGALEDEGPGGEPPSHRVRHAMRTSSCALEPADSPAATKGTWAPCSPPLRMIILLAFALFVAAILASGVRGPALARCYAAAQLVVALGCGLAAWRWRKDEGRQGGGTSTPSLPDRAGPAFFGYWRSVAPCVRIRFGWPPSPLPHKAELREPYASRPLSATVACALVVAFTEAANVPPYLGLPDWTSARAVYATSYLVLFVIQSAALARRSQI